MKYILNLSINLISGILFGSGLALSKMINPDKVLSFLDLFGQWDPSLMFVMLGALIVMFIATYLSKRMAAPFCASTFNLPNKKLIDLRLIVGAILFGIGWGLIGLCPGPAIASLIYLKTDSFIFFVSMFISMGIMKGILSMQK